MKKFMNLFHNAEEFFAGYALFLIAAGAALQVVLRYVCGICFDWFEESSRYVLILITFMGGGLAVKHGAHLSMDLATQYASDRLAHALKMSADLVAGVVMGFFCYFSWLQIVQSKAFGVLSPALRLPMWVPYLPIGLFSAVISLRFLLRSCRHLRAILYKEEYKRT